MKEVKAKKISVTNLFLLLILLAGIGIFTYPSFSNWWNSFHQSRAIESYKEEVAGMEESQIIRMLRGARRYNAKLRHKPDRFHLSRQEKREYSRLLDAGGTGIMAYIDIPVIKVSLPVYHGTKEEVLQIAIGHIEGSSLPVGGPGSHAVLSGHRGLPSAKLFSDIDRLKIGDRFTLHVLDKTLSYEVDRISTVLPEELKELEIRKGKDYVTLVTCTPYGVNTHRLLVRGRRVPVKKKEISETAHKRIPVNVIIIILISGVIVISLIIHAAGRYRREHKKKDNIFLFLFLLPLCLLPFFLPGMQQDVYAREQNQQDLSKQELAIKVQPAVNSEAPMAEAGDAGLVIDIYKAAEISSVSDSTFRLVSWDEYGYGNLFAGKDSGQSCHRGYRELSPGRMGSREWKKLSQEAAKISLGLSGEAGKTPVVTGAKPGDSITGLSPGLYLLVARGREQTGFEEPGEKRHEEKAYIRYVRDKEIVTIVRSEKYEYYFEPELVALVPLTPPIPLKRSLCGVAIDRGQGAQIFMKIFVKPRRPAEATREVPSDPGEKEQGGQPNPETNPDVPGTESDSPTGTTDKTTGPSPGYSGSTTYYDGGDGEKGSGGLVKTGDAQPILIYCILTILSVLAFLFFGRLLKKQKEETKT